MMAQAMTIYKNLVGNDLRSRPSNVSKSGSTDDDTSDGSTRQAEDEGPTSDAAAATAADAPPVQPVFSLQSPKDQS